MGILLSFLLFQEVTLPTVAVVTPAVLGAFATLIVGYFVKQKFNAYDRHLIECQEKNEDIAVLGNEVKNISQKVEDMAKDVKILLTHMPPAPLPPRSPRVKRQE